MLYIYLGGQWIICTCLRLELSRVEQPKGGRNLYYVLSVVWAIRIHFQNYKKWSSTGSLPTTCSEWYLQLISFTFFMQISNPKELAHAYKFLANYNLRKENFEEAYIAAQKCIDYPEVIMSCLPIKHWLTIINKLSVVMKCFKNSTTTHWRKFTAVICSMKWVLPHG